MANRETPTASKPTLGETAIAFVVSAAIGLGLGLLARRPETMFFPALCTPLFFRMAPSLPRGIRNVALQAVLFWLAALASHYLFSLVSSLRPR